MKALKPLFAAVALVAALFVTMTFAPAAHAGNPFASLDGGLQFTYGDVATAPKLVAGFVREGDLAQAAIGTCSATFIDIVANQKRVGGLGAICGVIGGAINNNDDAAAFPSITVGGDFSILHASFGRDVRTNRFMVFLALQGQF